MCRIGWERLIAILLLEEKQMPKLDSSAKRKDYLVRLASYASVVVAATLIIIKLYAWNLTDSVSILSSLVDSILDILASLVTAFAVHHALQPADREHRFGHGKAESIAGLGQSLFVIGSAFYLVYESVLRIFSPQAIQSSNTGIIVMLLSIFLSIVLVSFQRYVIKVSGSVAISADSLHYKGDILLNGSVILAIVLSTYFQWVLADPIIAISIAGYIFYLAYKLVRGSLDFLMDRELSDEDRERIKKVVLSHHEVEGIHDLRTRSSGRFSFIQFHLEIDGKKSLTESHRISDEVEGEVQKLFPDAEILIHQDPEGILEEQKTFE